MVALETPPVTAGWKAPDFYLPGIDGKSYSLADVTGPKGLVVMFICNHCPYVQAIIDKIVRDMAELKSCGVHAIAIMSNDTAAYPSDDFPSMKRFAADHQFGFPYVIDETQDIARAYDAVCTPDFFGFEAGLTLRYRGRLDSSRKDKTATSERELFLAMKQLAETGTVPATQYPSIGCNIKWRPAS